MQGYSEWISYTGNLPNVMLYELEIDENIQKVRACTFGRGIWEVDVYRAAPMAPVANFTADNTTINQGGTVNFTDLSTNNPTSWSWTFDGGTPATSALQNPANSRLKISHPEYKGSLLINIFNSSGSLVRKIMHNGGKTKQVNIAGLPAGAYSMILHDGTRKVERYFVKK